NGPHEEGGADPNFFNRDGLLQGKKRSTYEGGIRIPFIAKWPAKIKPGTVSDHQFAFYDLMATFADIAGVDNYKKYNPKGENDYFDGISIYPTLTGEGEQQEHEHLYWEFHETNMMGLRMGNWKLVVNAGNCKLYDLATDIHEDNDVAAQYPEIVNEMKARIKREHVDNNLFQVTLPK
ncbi:MAG: sulfatase-like hydrolase/transferase, partial [Bacteroidaceae bacterium]|nr:sulfatase-like hydrolase/transferase [Bacteroidaceae bacterium]